MEKDFEYIMPWEKTSYSSFIGDSSFADFIQSKRYDTKTLSATGDRMWGSMTSDMSTGYLDFDDTDIMREITERISTEVKRKKTNNEAYDNTVICDSRIDLDEKYILKNLSKMKAELMMYCAPLKVNSIVCTMTPKVKQNLITASKKLKMYGKERPFIARFDDYGRRLPDEININTIRGVNLCIVDPEEHGEFYLELKGTTQCC